MNSYKYISFTTHPYHIVDISPWPFSASMGCLYFTLGTVMYLHAYSLGLALTNLGIFIILFVMYLWWRDIVREGLFQGDHTDQVQKGLKNGTFLFIVSEGMLFFAIFWALFHSALSPIPEIGSVWPPQGIEIINAWGVPLLNTVILLSSGATLTWAHHTITGNDKESPIAFVVTLLLAVFFTGLQILEYVESTFTISDGIYGSTFFLSTGFHGFHVLIGTVFIFICFIRLLNSHFEKEHHIGFEASAWYWHFVDVVWILLFIVLYWWGSSIETDISHLI